MSFASVCLAGCLSVKSYLTSEVSVRPENTLSRTQRAMEVKNVWSFLLNLSVVEIQPLKAICTVCHFPAESAHAHYSIYNVVAQRVLHFSAFIAAACGIGVAKEGT